ncbi:hypothetical protein WG622_17465 [Cognatishimia sp. D5M38]|uniref:Polysaccharide deacetylase n=1 Tax=Cognatishimia coralii TaxID=3083254 RepID=A0ABU8QKW7_9RHOB
MHFTFEYIEAEYRTLLDMGYQFVTCQDAFDQFRATGQVNGGKLTVINRVDVDFSLQRAARLAAIYNSLGIKATFFVRLHAKEYNPFDFENFRHLRAIQKAGHEVGYHSEIVDQAAIWNEDASTALIRDLAIMETMLGEPVRGAASHGGLTGLNNLDFWADHKAEEFGLNYEAYQDGVMEASRYISDSEWVRWKAYENGVRLDEDQRSPTQHAIDDRSPLIYLLVHPDTYFDRHIYEN